MEIVYEERPLLAVKVTVYEASTPLEATVYAFGKWSFWVVKGYASVVSRFLVATVSFYGIPPPEAVATGICVPVPVMELFA